MLAMLIVYFHHRHRLTYFWLRSVGRISIVAAIWWEISAYSNHGHRV
jgi:hypothetical protein